MTATPPAAGAIDATPPAAGAIDAVRQFGAVEAVRALLPPGLDPAIFAVTQLGDTWLLLIVLTLFVWYGGDRDGGALAVALALGALALVVGLKHLFALPRPPAELMAYPEEGYGFPSGHALGGTVAWGAMAWLGGRSTRRTRLAVAVPVAVAVGFSRVLLGVHYLGSVLAGFAVGVAFLAGGLRLARGDPVRGFAMAAALAVLAIAAGAVGDGATVLGGALGGALVCRHVDLAGPVHPVTALSGLVVFGGLWAGVTAVEPPWPALVLANGAVVAGLLSVPAVERSTRTWLAPAGEDGTAQKVSR